MKCSQGICCFNISCNQIIFYKVSDSDYHGLCSTHTQQILIESHFQCAYCQAFIQRSTPVTSPFSRPDKKCSNCEQLLSENEKQLCLACFYKKCTKCLKFQENCYHLTCCGIICKNCWEISGCCEKICQNCAENKKTFKVSGSLLHFCFECLQEKNKQNRDFIDLGKSCSYGIEPRNIIENNDPQLNSLRELGMNDEMVECCQICFQQLHSSIEFNRKVCNQCSIYNCQKCGKNKSECSPLSCGHSFCGNCKPIGSICCFVCYPPDSICQICAQSGITKVILRCGHVGCTCHYLNICYLCILQKNNINGLFNINVLSNPTKKKVNCCRRLTKKYILLRCNHSICKRCLVNFDIGFFDFLCWNCFVDNPNHICVGCKKDAVICISEDRTCEKLCCGQSFETHNKSTSIRKRIVQIVGKIISS